MRTGDPVKMKEVNTGLKRVEKGAIREMTAERGIIKRETVEVVRGKKVLKVIMEIKTEEVMPGMSPVAGVTMMIRLTEKCQVLRVSMESRAPPLI